MERKRTRRQVMSGVQVAVGGRQDIRHATSSPTVDSGYEAFPNIGRRNFLQETLEVPIMLRALAVPRGARILEVGCGRGIALRPIADGVNPRRLVGLDIEPDFIAEATARAQRFGLPAELIEGDVRRLPFEDASFDVVIDFGTCYHIAQPGRALAEIARVLCPGGLFVHETRLSQLMAHPVRSFGRTLPWSAAPFLIHERHAGLWASRARL
jgi:ubiquinone/menaquinone biosynthesis C-methylase UbiE